MGSFRVDQRTMADEIEAPPVGAVEEPLDLIRFGKQTMSAICFYIRRKGLASYCKAETTFTFYFSILTLSNAFLGIDNREMKSESGFSFAIASQPFRYEAIVS